MKLTDRVLERKVLRAITSGTPGSEYLLGVLSDDHFFNSSNREAFRRIQSIAKTRNSLLTWTELIHDLALSETAREALKLFHDKVNTTLKSCKTLYGLLERYRKVRVIYNGSKVIADELLKESINEEKLTDLLYDTANNARFKADSILTYNIGEGNSSSKLFESILTGKNLVAFPTGFKAFDNINRGFFKGSLVLLGGNTGSGKSSLLMQLADNFADNGAKVAVVSLEMTEEELAARQAAKYSKVSLLKIIDPDKLDDSDKTRIRNAYKKRVETLKKRGAVIALKIPQEDLSIEEILFQLKPYGYDIIGIDYASLLRDTDGVDQWRKLNSVARFCKIFARNNNCVVVLLVQITPDGVLRFSKAMADHCNNAFFFVVDQRSRELGIIPIKQVKARMGKEFDFILKSELDTMTIHDIAESDKKNIENWQEKSQSSKTKGRTHQRRNITASNQANVDGEFNIDDDDIAI